ncbi:MAG: site-specific integrase [Xanthobacteraceae bacterium]
MPRKVKHRELDSREARSKLKPRGMPYYGAIDKKLHIGYRRLKGKAGTWWARHYIGERQYEIDALGAADDLSDADGTEILNYWQAQDKARERMTLRTHAATGKTGPLTVRDVVKDYLEFLETNRKSAYDARRRADVFIYPTLGDLEAAELTTDRLERWHTGLPKTAPRLRTKKGEKQKHREVADNDDARRARQATANRTLTILKAALNRAWRRGKIPSNAAWARVEPFENVDAARVRYLTVAEAKRLINSVDIEFRPLVQAALETGARYSELTRLQVRDFNRDAGTIAISQSKAGNARHVVLTSEGAALFKQLVLGRPGGDLLLPRADGTAWKKSQQDRRIKKACGPAKIAPRISFHILRHTWASLSVMNGVPLLVVAKNLGHSDTRMVEKHYGHLAPSYIADAIREGAPRFGFKPDRKVATLAVR